MLFQRMFGDSLREPIEDGGALSFWSHARVIKKSLIYLVMILDNLRNYARIKTPSGLDLKRLIEQDVSARNEQFIRRILTGSFEWTKSAAGLCYAIDQKLFRLSLEQLVERIQIEDVLLYIKLSRTNFTTGKPNPKTRSRRRKKNLYIVKNLKSKKYYPDERAVGGKRESRSGANRGADRIRLEEYQSQIHEIFLVKKKRDDELYKQSFKEARKSFFKQFREASTANSVNLDHVDVQNQFYKQVLRSNPVYISAHEEGKVKTTTIANYMRCAKFNEFVHRKFARDFVIKKYNQTILKERDWVLSDKVSIEGFMQKLMTNEKKNKLVVQDIVNSLGLLLNFSPDKNSLF